jgi:hypothetical protein
VLIFRVDPVPQLWPEARILLQQLAYPEALLGDRALPIRAAFQGLHLPFQKMQDQPRQPALDNAPFAFGHILDLLGNVIQVGLRHTARTQQFGVSHSPLREVPLI